MVAVFPVVSTVDDVLGKVIVVLSLPANVRLLLTVSVFPTAIAGRSSAAAVMNTCAFPDRLIALLELVDFRTVRVSVVPDDV